MKNPHYPFELLDQVNSWIEKNKPKPSLEQEEVRHELLKINKTIKDLQDFGCEAPLDLLEKQKKVEDKLCNIIDSEDMQLLSDLRSRLSELVSAIDKIIRKSSGNVRAPFKRLRVKFDNGVIFDFPQAVDTFISALQHIGLNKCAQCVDITHRNHVVVAKTRYEYSNLKSGRIREVDGFFVQTKSSTDLKAKFLKDFAMKLGIGVSVEIIE